MKTTRCRPWKFGPFRMARPLMTRPSSGVSRVSSILATALLWTFLLSAPLAAQIAAASPEYTGADRIENWRGKTVLVFSPHPDDDMFTSAGTMALLAANGNRVIVVVYTQGNAGSADPEMTAARLGEIRKGEEIKALGVLGIPAENLVWMGYDDGMLEYADMKILTREAAAEIRRHKPDAVFAPDPGAPHLQYHKSDHRAAATVSADAIRAARWRLYFPELEEQGLLAWNVPLQFLYYSAHPNYTVDTTAVAETAVRALASNISQFGRRVQKYDPEISTEERAELMRQLLPRTATPDGHHIEKFRREE